MKTLLILFGFLIGIQSQNQGTFGVPISPEELLEIKDKTKILDFRPNHAHELDGFIEGSTLLNQNTQELFGLQNETVVYVVDGGQNEAMEAEKELEKYGILKFRCYLSGMEKWKKIGKV